MILRSTGFDQVRKSINSEKLKPVRETIKKGIEEEKKQVKQLLKK